MKTTMIFVVLMVFFLQGCVETNQNSSTTENLLNNESAVASVEKIEVFHFHGTNQCYSCKTVGAYAEETVNTYFGDEIKSGKLIFGHINGELPENRDLVVKYGATGSSLWIGTYTKDGRFKAEQNTNVWYKISNKEDYMTYLKGVIEQKLAGN